MCEKYGIPKYDQRELMNAYEGQETNYGRAPQKTYATFDEALAARKAGTDNARVEE